MKALALFAALAAVAGGVWYGFGRAASDAPPIPPSPLPAAKQPAEGPLPVTTKLPERRPAPPAVDALAAHVEFPDGSRYAPLNGVTVTLKPTFHPRLLQYTKVVGIERDGRGRDWYVHENGARSTVYVNSDGAAVAEIEAPSAAQPMLPDEGPGGADATRK